MVLDASQQLQALLNRNNLQYLCDRQQEPPLYYYGGIEDGEHKVEQSGAVLPAGRIIGHGAPAIGDPVLRVSEGGFARTLGRPTPQRRDRRRGRRYFTPALWFGDNYQGQVLSATGDFNLQFRTAPVISYGVDFFGNNLLYFNATYATQRTFTTPQRITINATITPQQTGSGLYPFLTAIALPWVKSPVQPRYTTMEELRSDALVHYQELPAEQRTLPPPPANREDFVPRYIGLNSAYYSVGLPPEFLAFLTPGFGYQGDGGFGQSVFQIQDLLATEGDGRLGSGVPVSESLELTITTPGDYLIVLTSFREVNTGSASAGSIAQDTMGDGIYDVAVDITAL